VEHDLGCLAEAAEPVEPQPDNPLLPDPPPAQDLGLTVEDATLDDLKIALSFITLIRSAMLENGSIDPDTIDRLRNPEQGPPDVDDPDLILAIKIYLATTKASDDVYKDVGEAISERFAEWDFLSMDRLKRKITTLTGIAPVTHDMCINSCIGYTGPYSDLIHCPACGTLRYDPLQFDASRGVIRIPQQTFCTLPLGPQLQALWRSKKSARAMRYRSTRTRQLLEEIQANGGVLDVYEDFLSGSEYLNAFTKGQIEDHDTALLFSLDGAQLFEQKTSSCWISIWVILDIDPEGRYKVAAVCPDTFIPGPKQPKIFDSFLYPSLHHVSALQREGFFVWDANDETIHESHPFFVNGAADGPGATHLHGLTGHQGYYSCRLYCPIKGRRIAGENTYYPVHLKPTNYILDGCDHADYPFHSMPIRPPGEYLQNLRYLVASANRAQYEERRKETGIVRPSILTGLQSERMIPAPRCCGADLMHLVAFNSTDSNLSLWRGTIVCKPGDDKATWDWAVLQGDVWQQHGATVARMTPYLPGSFDVPPRNPAEKISSGYKAWEYLTYMYVLGPGLLYNILPEPYFQNYCKFVLAIRILHQRRITKEELKQAHDLLIGYVKEFEEIYCQRRVERLHFCRPALHGVLHLAHEVARLGPPCYYSQWTMERTIGNLTEEMKQPSKPYANLAQRGIRRAQTNALKAIIPTLVRTEKNPRGSVDLGNGYVLLRAKDKNMQTLQGAPGAVIRTYLEEATGEDLTGWNPRVSRWARLRIPNGQIARSAWKEKLKALEHVRMSRNVRVCLPCHHTV
jgi:hypothetical protein